MVNARAKFADRHIIAAKLIGDDNARFAPALHQLVQETFGSRGFSAILYENFKRVAVGVDRPPQPVLLSPDRDHHFVQMPLIGGGGPVSSDLRGNLRAGRVSEVVEI